MQTAEATENGEDDVGDQSNDDAGPPPSPQPLSKNAQKKLLKQQRFEAKKAEKKAAMKEHKKREGERKRKEWDQMLEGATEEERKRLIDSRKGLRKERMEKRSKERENKVQRLIASKHHGQNIVVDFEFSHLMTTSEIHSLVQQVLTVNQVIEVLLKFLETKDWKTSFFQVIPQRKRCESASEEHKGDSDREGNEEKDDQIERKRKSMELESPPHHESIGTDLNS
ncbi:uncharacterized protein LOC130760150 isoform X2 [Actinidia eriantha]|uniref:uncharacterized protein LOC130760150 isoform X2 n=1 Tax=Actinidia eriantha TaxID=165200 RepID=UPI0025895451|nr:uncharacterized protein LOC130760150 isoform X2 [Actinidia eriantha]